MNEFFELLEAEHKDAMDSIKHMIDVEAQKYPEDKDAAILCKFLVDSTDRYAMILESEVFDGFYDNAQVFESLCNSIYHSLTDDGDIAFVQVNNHCPAIVFQSRWELKLEDLVSKNEQAMYDRLNKFKKEKGLPPHENTILFFNNVYEYIAAVDQYRIDSEAQMRRIDEWNRMRGRLEGREKPNMDEVEFGTPHLKED